MRNPMLPLSPMSNDGLLQHKPTLAPAGLDCCSRPFADLGKVRFQAIEVATNDWGRWIFAVPLSARN